MARKNRGRVPSGTYHVWRRATGPIAMFVDDMDRASFTDRLGKSIARQLWTCHSFVLMPTHFHLVVTVEDDVLPRSMHATFAPYAQGFNRRWGRSGHLRAAPYKLRRVEDDADFQGLIRYVARNPVRDGLCENPQDWYWSSYPGTAGYARAFRFVDDELVLGILDEDRTRASWLLRLIVESA